MIQTRLHALDAIRGIALLLGLWLHSTMSFWPSIAALGIPIIDNSPSMTLVSSFYVLHMFRMAVFFLIAGFFAHLSLHRKGPRSFLKDRLKRIAIPMIVGFILSTILIIPTLLWAARKYYGPEFLNALQTTAPAGAVNGNPELSYFWFLYYLLLFYFISVPCSMLLKKLDAKDRLMTAVTAAFHGLCRLGLVTLIPAVISAWIFYRREIWSLWAGIPSPSVQFWHEAPAFYIYGMAFLVGWLCNRQRDCLAAFQKHWAIYFAIAVVLTVVSYRLLNPTPLIYEDIGDENRLVYAFTYSFATWCWIFAFIGAGMKFFSGESEFRRYVADASYWVYVTHVPIIFFLQTLLMDVNLHWIIKFPVVLGVTIFVTFLTYEHLVRYTIIGRTLNGPRQRRRDSDPPASEPRPQSA